MPIIDEFRGWLAKVVEVPREHRVLLRCPVRNRDFIDGPEERIRQGLLHFLIGLADKGEFVLAAERDRHDIDLRWPAVPEFRPPVPPLLIVETKVDTASGDWDGQLERYLNETGGDCGIIFTGRRMWTRVRANNSFESVRLDSLEDLALVVRRRAAMDPLAFVRKQFDAACGGSVEALRTLVAQYPYATFLLQIGDLEVACRNVHFAADSLEYRPAGHYTRHVARVDTQRIARLLRVEP